VYRPGARFYRPARYHQRIAYRAEPIYRRTVVAYRPY